MLGFFVPVGLDPVMHHRRVPDDNRGVGAEILADPLAIDQLRGPGAGVPHIFVADPTGGLVAVAEIDEERVEVVLVLGQRIGRWVLDGFPKRLAMIPGFLGRRN